MILMPYVLRRWLIAAIRVTLSEGGEFLKKTLALSNKTRIYVARLQHSQLSDFGRNRPGDRRRGWSG